ncbi:hypothetical protein TRFO_11140 [Tritrichomonas foetus]|uniref:Uncharacterized protein n=1 Tax=Tritrichomonas foetus TaxID=1144522 RepID=A0A1J4J5G5_9EUKA|nr:hypothetical protein TRFO_11140 [Tritrichomonas foetus]|eukprot:OHS94502.1 hypothetical protein TRFO_11140 [Tritrichomonas foetus]
MNKNNQCMIMSHLATGGKKSCFIQQLDDDSIKKINQIINNASDEIDDLQNQIEKLNSLSKDQNSSIDDLKRKHENEISKFNNMYREKMLEIASKPVPKQIEFANKAKDAEKQNDFINADKYMKMSIKIGEETIQQRINQQEIIFSEKYNKILQNHEKELNETQKQLKIGDKKSVKLLNRKLNEATYKRDMSLLEVRTDYLNTWGKTYPNDDRHLAYVRFMNFFESILQEKGIQVPKATSLFGNKLTTLTENEKSFLMSRKFSNNQRNI